MNDLLVGICGYLALQGNQINACHTAINQTYNISSYKPMFDARQKELEKYSQELYEEMPLKAPISALSAVIYETVKKDYKIPISNHVNLEYTNFNTGTCNLKWEF